MDGLAGQQLIIIQATPYCNLDCTYCYLQQRFDRSIIDQEVLQSVFEVAATDPHFRSPVTLLWHAGEPLVLGVDFYEKAWDLAVSCFEGSGKDFRFALQTNGVALNDRWIEFLKARPGRVEFGLSIDGPAFLHDRQRVFRNGRGSHRFAMNAVQLLKQAGVPFGVICVLTRESLKFPDEVFGFFAENGFESIGFNVEETEGGHVGLDASDELRGAYYRFMRRVIELKASSGATISIREYDRMLGMVVGGGHSEIRNSTTTPKEIVTFTRDGSYATFCPELAGTKSERFERFVMGDIRGEAKGTLAGFIEDPLFVEVNAEIQAGVEACRKSCDYFSVCGGGFPSNKFWETGRFDVTETSFCRLHVKTLADVILDLIDDGAIAV